VADGFFSHSRMRLAFASCSASRYQVSNRMSIIHNAKAVLLSAPLTRACWPCGTQQLSTLCDWLRLGSSDRLISRNKHENGILLFVQHVCADCPGMLYM